MCSTWRNFALGTSSLWRELEFKGKRNDIKRAEVYMERCNDGPLFIIMDLYPDRPNVGSEIEKILDLIVSQVGRWGSLKAKIAAGKPMNIVLDRLYACKEAPQLRSLCLLAFDYYEVADFGATEGVDRPKRLFSGNTPMLRQLFLHGVPLAWEANLAVFAGLENLVLQSYHLAHRPSYEQWARILSRAHNIRSITVSDSGPNATNQSLPHEGTIIVSRLEELIIGSLEPATATAIMHRLDTPRLRVLELDPGQEYAYKNFLHRVLLNARNPFSPLPRLNELRLGCLNLTPGDVETLYGSLPVLRVLRLDLTTLQEHFLTLINPPSKVAASRRYGPLPNLTELFLIGEAGVLEPLKTTVRRRQAISDIIPQLCTKIEKLVLCWLDTMLAPEAVKRLRTLVEDVRVLAGDGYDGAELNYE